MPTEDDIKSNLQAHIEDLVREHDIKMDQRYNLAGMMYVEEEPPRIEVPSLVPCRHAPSVALCYMVALHEIGHVVMGHTQGRPPHIHKTHYFDNGVLKSEAEAWMWALKNRKCKLEQWESEYMAERYIGSYRERAFIEGSNIDTTLRNGNRHHVTFRWDDPNNRYVIDVIRKLKNSYANTTEEVYE